MLNKLESIDTIVIGLYFILILGIGFYFSRKNRTSTDYFLAGRNVGWIAIGASLFASSISSEHFISLAGSGATSGLAVGNFYWLGCFSILILGWIFAPIYLKNGVFTIPEYLEKRYNKTSRIYLSSVSILFYVLIKISVILFAGGLILNQVLGWDFYTSAIIIVVVTGIYTIVGGLGAVIYTSVAQAVILIGGTFALMLFGLKEVDGLSALQQQLSPDFFSMVKPLSHSEFPWTGIVFGLPILGICYWCTDQYMVQRVLSARNISQARSGTILAGFLSILPVLLLIIPGLIAVALFPNITGDKVFPSMLTGILLPAGIKGLVIASLLAALMSSLATCFNSSSTLFTIDFYKPNKPKASEEELVLVGRLATTVLVILAILWVTFIEYISITLFMFLQNIQAYIAPPIAAVFLIGLLWKRVNGKGATWTLITGAIIGAFRIITELLNNAGYIHSTFLINIAQMNLLHFAIFLFIVSASVLLFVSLMTNPPVRAKVTGLTFATAHEVQTEFTQMVESRNSDWTKTNIGLSLWLIITIIFLYTQFF